MTKAELRKQGREQRKNLLPEEAVIHSLSIIQHFQEADFLWDIQVLHVFLPIRKQKEVDNWPLIHRIWESYPHIQVVTSVSDLETREMRHFPLTPDTPVVENAWGIPEPEAEEMIAEERIDLVLLPLLAFDRSGYRVGYGMGFYDRFLAKCRKDVRKVGFSFFGPSDRIDDVDRYDIPMDACVTPEGCCYFR